MSALLDASIIYHKNNIIHMEFYNKSNKDYYLLNFNMPDKEGIMTNDIFEIIQNKEKIKYKGMFAHRGSPSKDNFIRILPKQKYISYRIDLNEHYKLIPSWRVYDVRIDIVNQSINEDGDIDFIKSPVYKIHLTGNY